MQTLAIIPARGGSKGIPRKNIVRIGGKPLLAYTIEAARQSGVFDRIVVSTDDRAIGRVAKRYGSDVIERPATLARDTTPTEPVMLHVIRELAVREHYQPDAICLLQATSPLRNAGDIRAAFRIFARGKIDSLLSVAPNTCFVWRRHGTRCMPLNYDCRYRPRRQEMGDQFRENGALYITKRSHFMRSRNRLSGRIGYYVMSDERSIEIDSPLDLVLARLLLVRGRGKRSG